MNKTYNIRIITKGNTMSIMKNVLNIASKKLNIAKKPVLEKSREYRIMEASTIIPPGLGESASYITKDDNAMTLLYYFLFQTMLFYIDNFIFASLSDFQLFMID